MNRKGKEDETKGEVLEKRKTRGRGEDRFIKVMADYFNIPMATCAIRVASCNSIIFAPKQPSCSCVIYLKPGALFPFIDA